MKIQKSRGFTAALVATGILGALAIGLWGFQLVDGLSNTNMRNLDSWGLYITGFTFMVGLSAGGLIISSVPKAFGFEGYGGISKIAIWCSIVCTALAVVFVVIDLGQPLRVWEMIVFGNLSSPLLWDFVVIMIYLILSLIYLAATMRYEKGSVSAVAIKALSIAALTVAILVHSITAWIFGLQAAHEFWHTALLAPWFVSSALVSGLALVLLVVVALRHSGYLSVEATNMAKMGRLLALFLIVDFYFFGCELLTMGYSGGGYGSEMLAVLTSGTMAPFFWCEIIGGLVAIAVLLVPKMRTPGWIVLASILAIVGIFCKRVQLVFGGFTIRAVDAPTLTTGVPLENAGLDVAAMLSTFTYFPSPFEMLLTFGILCLGAFGILVGVRFLNLGNGEKGE